jgi:acyl-CoA oxidase
MHSSHFDRPLLPISRKQEEERAKASFSVRQLTYVLDGGEHFTKLKEQMMKRLESNLALFDNTNQYDMNVQEEREATMRRVLFE